jgi:hypothetical protein
MKLKKKKKLAKWLFLGTFKSKRDPFFILKMLKKFTDVNYFRRVLEEDG